MSSATASSPSAKQDTLSDTGVFAMIKQTAKDWSEDNAMRLAAAMACYIILALAPLLVISIKVLYLVLKERTDDVVRGQLDQLIGPAGGQAIGEMIANANRGGGGTAATIVSLVIVVFSASGVFVSLQDALNTIWEVKPKPNAGWIQWVRKRFLSIGMVFGIAVLLLTSMAVTGALHVIIDSIFGSEATGFAKAVAYVVDFVATIAIAWVLFMAVFKFLPDAKVSWNDVWVGALATAVLFKIGQAGMAIYFNYGSATSAYGAFGSIVAVLLWAYYSSMIMFFGAEFTQVWAKAHGRGIEPEAHAVKVTEGERAEQGMPSRERVAAAPAGGEAPPSSAPRPRPRYATGPVLAPVTYSTPADRRTAFGLGGAAIGAVAAGLATWYFDQKLTTRKRTAQVQLDRRINAIESKLGRVSRMKEYLEQMDVKERIDRVEHEIRRAGGHVRAKETGRPLWMVRLGDLIGGRWSNL
jgi:membrane protein